MELTKSTSLVVHIPDTRGVVLSPYGRGNLKIGPGVYTYSRLPGRTGRWALGHVDSVPVAREQPAEVRPGRGPLQGSTAWKGTCPGSTPECERICYARRPVEEAGPVAAMWLRNSMSSAVPPLPADAKLVRIHVSGDFDTVEYVEAWIARLTERPDVRAWGYTRSWRVPELLPALERLRALPNLQLFASMDRSTPGLPPEGWRRAWIDGDERAGEVHRVRAHSQLAGTFKDFETQATGDGIKTLICPEETRAVPNCESCGFCFAGPRNDVTFLEH